MMAVPILALSQGTLEEHAGQISSMQTIIATQREEINLLKRQMNEADSVVSFEREDGHTIEVHTRRLEELTTPCSAIVQIMPRGTLQMESGSTLNIGLQSRSTSPVMPLPPILPPTSPSTPPVTPPKPPPPPSASPMPPPVALGYRYTFSGTAHNGCVMSFTLTRPSLVTSDTGQITSGWDSCSASSCGGCSWIELVPSAPAVNSGTSPETWDQVHFRAVSYNGNFFWNDPCLTSVGDCGPAKLGNQGTMTVERI